MQLELQYATGLLISSAPARRTISPLLAIGQDELQAPLPDHPASKAVEDACKPGPSPGDLGGGGNRGPWNGGSQGLSNLHARLQAILVKAIAAPGPRKVQAISTLPAHSCIGLNYCDASAVEALCETCSALD